MAAPPPAASFEKGVVFGLFAREDFAHADRGLTEIRDLGATSVSIMIPWVTPDVRSMVMAPRGDMTPTDAALSAAMRKARALGLSVLIMPFLYVDHMAEGEWRGTLAPPDWEAWFARYGEFVLHYAKLAAKEGAALFSIGSELCSTEQRREDWVRLITRVRAVYRGKLTYSANWDHREAIRFADHLDVLGMNAYFNLATVPEVTEESLAAAWAAIIKNVEAWRAAQGLDLIVTEVGYPSRKGAAADPWNYGASVDARPDPEIQRLCYRAFRRAWEGHPALKGVYFYQWWGDGGPMDPDYTPRGKPAEQELRDWFRREPVVNKARE